MNELIILANRLPVSYDPRVGWQRAPGGLVTALSPVMRRRSARWFGWAESDVSELHPSTERRRLVQLPFTGSDRADFYNGLCNRTLWPALHGFRDHVEYRESWWAAYQRCNRIAASMVAAEAPDGATIWVHDYHFALVPRLLRAERSDLAIGVFLHTPVDAATVAELGIAEDLVEGLRNADVAGTQTARDAVELRDLLGVGDAPTIEASPISVDPDDLDQLRRDPVANARAAALRSRAAGATLFVGIDRLDYTKGIVQRLEAFELLLDAGELVADHAQLVQVASPSRTDVPAYRSLADHVAATCARINARHRRSDGRSVVRLVREHLPQREVAGHLLATEVALVTPVRDGMNLVSKEFALLAEGRDASLVLSGGAGAADELRGSATIVDGASPTSIAGGIVATLATPPDVRRARADAMAAAVRRHPVGAWSDEQLALIESVAGERGVVRN